MSKKQLFCKTVVCIVLLLVQSMSYASRKLVDVLHSSDIVARVTISSSTTHYLPVPVNGRRVPCHYTYDGVVEDVLKGSVPDKLTFSEYPLVTDGDYLLFLSKEGYSGRAYILEEERLECKKIKGPVTLLALEVATVAYSRSFKSVPLVMRDRSPLLFPNDYELLVKYNRSHLSFPDEIKPFVISYWDCTSGKENKDGEIKVSLENIESQCEIHSAEPFVKWGELVEYIKNAVDK